MSAASASDRRAAEASAACRIDLFGWALGLVPASARPASAASIAVALDRRPFAHVETGHDRVRLESKDSLLKLEVARVDELPATGLAGLVRGVLLELGIGQGLTVKTQARVPFGAGLGSAGALAVAVAAAAARATGAVRSEQDLAAFAAHGEAFEPCLPAAGWAAVWGGIVAAPASPSKGPAERLGVDPARIEECLLLVEVPSGTGGSNGSAGGTEPGVEARSGREGAIGVAGATVGDEAARVVGRARAALLAGRYFEIPELLVADIEAGRAACGESSASFDRLSALVRGAGGVARPGAGPQGLALVWAAPGERGPGPRERVTRAVQAAGYRTFPCRVDLRGLEVEDA